ncbi:MAG: PotD/PotF family extracellular solute-binding protein [Candidatus Competibacterales bacterium]
MKHRSTAVFAPPSPSRRRFLALAGAAGALGLGGSLPPARAADGLTLTLADIGVGDPNGNWSAFESATDFGVNVVSMGNGPAAVLNQLIAGGGRQSFDVINIVGGMQKPLVDNGLILPIDIEKMPHWAANDYIQTYLAPGTPGFDFIGYRDRVYGVPTVLQGDSFAYLPEITGELDSYAALFDPKFKGYVALEDNYTTAGQKTALYLKSAGLATIADPADMTPSELATVMDFLIEQKRAGQFRVIWSSFEQAVNLLVNREVHVMDCWEPMVFVAVERGVAARYAAPKEGYLLWAMAAHVVANDPDAERLAARYALLDYMLGPAYGAAITGLRGYMTNPGAPAFAAADDAYDTAAAERIAAIDAGVKAKFRAGGTWQNRWPTHVEAYEEEWQRFKAA